MKKIGSYLIKPTGRPRKFDNEKIKQMINDEISDQIIAAVMGCSRSRVVQIRQQMGLYKRKHGFPLPRVDYSKALDLYSQGKNDREISEKIGCSAPTITKWRHGNGLLCVTKVKQSSCCECEDGEASI